MVIIAKPQLLRFGLLHSDATESLNDWYKKARNADWTCLADVKQTFRSVDFVGNDRFVFNIKGNSYRLVAMIFFNKRTLYIRFIGTHAEYDKIDCSTI